MGDISASKMPGAKKKARRDDTDFTQYKEGGKVKSKVNAAGNYTKPELRKRIFNSVKAAAIVGTGAGQWSARKAQVMAKRYKAAGGGYRD
jgi:putative N-acetylmannosamine-6-phosphate epimerase